MSETTIDATIDATEIDTTEIDTLGSLTSYDRGSTVIIPPPGPNPAALAVASGQVEEIAHVHLKGESQVGVRFWGQVDFSGPYNSNTLCNIIEEK